MDRSVPAHAAVILDFIGGIEAPNGYDTIYANKQKQLPKRITKMTLAEVQNGQRTRWQGLVKSSASGRYQFMYDTLGGLIVELKLSLNQRFDANLQDRLAYHLLKRRGLDQWLADEISAAEFAKRLAQEWASLPVLLPTKGAHRKIGRGVSYYAGDALNKSLIAPEKVEETLEKALAIYKQGVAKPERSKLPEKVAGGAAAGGGAVVAVEQSGVTFDQVTEVAVKLAPYGLPVLGLAVAVGVAYFIYRKWKG